MARQETPLLHVDPKLIDQNPDNPRLIFREDEMLQLQDSIASVGILVPLSVYRFRSRYVLIDGERRWRCARRLNLREVPVIVQPKPGRLENILTMFNIHNVRTDWDLMPMALKMDDVRRLLQSQKKSAGVKELSGLTGVSSSSVRRALELLTLPKRYQRMLLEEAKKPRDQQKVTADLFVEINKSKRAIKSYVPEAFDRYLRCLWHCEIDLCILPRLSHPHH